MNEWNMMTSLYFAFIELSKILKVFISLVLFGFPLLEIIHTHTHAQFIFNYSSKDFPLI